MNGQTFASARQTTAVTGAKTITAATSATAVAARGSRARASRRFQIACRKAAASASAKANAGIQIGSVGWPADEQPATGDRVRLQRHALERRADHVRDLREALR